MAKATEWIVEGRHGRSTVYIDFDARNVVIMPADGEDYDISFEALGDMAEALEQARHTINATTEDYV